MRFYQIDYGPAMGSSYCMDLKGVKTATRNMMTAQRVDVVVRLVDIPTDKANILRLLNGPLPAAPVRLRQWRVTAAHRYVEIPADED